MAASATGTDVYEYEVNEVKHTAQFTAEDAKRLGAKKVKEALAPVAAPTVASKAAPTPENK
ncbi:hypothetical protein SEA_WIDOW_6 [Gordonia phage Widow]|nr:hypothetical protein SEA_WIDOW_6 [Gordonia phage Widow]